MIPVPVPFVPAPPPVRAPIAYDAYLDIRPFVRFDPDGAIRQSGQQGIGFTLDEMRQNPYVCPGDGGYDDDAGIFRHWVDHDGDMPIVAARTPLGLSFDNLDLEPYQEARISELPAGRVSFTGPVSDSLEHPGGLFEIGWTIPGEYILTIEVWPHLPALYTFTVA